MRQHLKNIFVCTNVSVCGIPYSCDLGASSVCYFLR